MTVSRDDEPGETPEQGRDATRREAHALARRLGWVPLGEEPLLRRAARWLAGDRQ